MPSDDKSGVAGRRSLRLEVWAYRLTLLIAVTTIAAGLVQLVVPGFILNLLDGSSTPSTRHFFAIVGMFMAVIGAALMHALITKQDHPVLIWAAVQKFGAFLAVSLGVINDIFSSLGIAVAINDLLSAGVILWYLRMRMAHRAQTSSATRTHVTVP
jgi:hypothetical protein